MGSISKVVGMIPGLSSNLIPKGKEKESTDRIKKFMCIMDSMTDKELDCEVEVNESRLFRIARGAGAHPREVQYLLEEHKRFAKMVESMGKMGLGNIDQEQLKKNPQAALKNAKKAMDPKAMQNLQGQMGGMMDMMKNMDPNEMQQMQDMMQGMMGGGGGMPGMGGLGGLAQMAQGMMGGAGGAGGRNPGIPGMGGAGGMGGLA
jgi:signal recognition particle subunit SRP54